MERLLNLFDAIGEWIGRLVALAIFLMVGIVAFEIIGRHFFNAPTRWVHDASGWLQVGYVFLGGAFALQRGYFVRVDLFYGRMSPRGQAWVDVTLSTALFAMFAGVMIWNGFGLAMSSYRMGEVSSTGTWGGPVWPAKFMIPIGVALLSLAWISRVGRQLILLRRRDARE